MGHRDIEAAWAFQQWRAARGLDPVAKLADSFMLKLALQHKGVRLDPSALAGVGERWKEQVQLYFFNPNLHHKQRREAIPAAIILPHDLYVVLLIREDTPFVLRRDDGVLRLWIEDQPLVAVEYAERPAYYGKHTTTGVEMRLIGANWQRRAMEITYNSYCVLFAEHADCRFCNMSAERPLWTRRHRSYFIATPAEVAEVARAAYDEGACRTLDVLGGILPRRAEIPYTIQVGRALQTAFSTRTVAGANATCTPPKDRAQIDELYDAGYDYLSFNLEVWSEGARAVYTPGKATRFTHAAWLAAMEHARDVAGPFRVGSAFVAGLEPMNVLLSGVEYLLERGIGATPIPWSVMPGSGLEGHRPPSSGWYLEFFNRVLDLYEKYEFPYPLDESTGPLQPDLALLRRDLSAEPATGSRDPRYALAVEGRWPEL